MFSREQRLSDTKLYALVFKRGTWARGKHCSIVWLPSHTAGKVGFIITKKVSKSSAHRNESKRRVRAALQQLLRETEASPLKTNNLVVVLHRENRDVPFSVLRQEVQQTLSKVKREQ